jgi:hypothetical protein
MDTWIECAWFKCRKRFEPSKRSNRFYRADGPSHEGAVYCSPACKQKAYRLRSRTVTKSPEGTDILRTVTRPKDAAETKQEFSTKNGHPRPSKWGAEFDRIDAENRAALRTHFAKLGG